MKEYRQQLNRLGIAAAPCDPQRRKAFDGATSGEVLGIWFDTENLTWKLPERKISTLVQELLCAAAVGSLLTLNQVEIIYGKLTNFAQHAWPIQGLVSEILVFMNKMLEEHKGLDRASMSRSRRQFEIPQEMKHDLKTVACIIRHTSVEPLPILEHGFLPSCNAVLVYTDASGHLLSNPSVGIYAPSQGLRPAMVASLALPRCFLNKVDKNEKKCYCKSTTLEGLGLLAALCCDPQRFKGKDVVYFVDNQATV